MQQTPIGDQPASSPAMESILVSGIKTGNFEFLYLLSTPIKANFLKTCENSKKAPLSLENPQQQPSPSYNFDTKNEKNQIFITRQLVCLTQSRLGQRGALGLSTISPNTCLKEAVHSCNYCKTAKKNKENPRRLVKNAQKSEPVKTLKFQG